MAAPIQTSPFFVPSIIAAYSRATLGNAAFPAAQLHRLMERGSLSRCSTGDIDTDGRSYSEDVAVVAALRANRAPFVQLDAVQAEALTGTIAALGTQLALPVESIAPPRTDEDVGVGQPDNRGDKDIGALVARSEQRVLLGFCRLLAHQYVQALADLDLARSEVFGRQQRQMRRRQRTHQPPQLQPRDAGPRASGAVSAPSATSIHDAALMTHALWGLELAARLVGKDADAQRFRQWRQKSLAQRAGE